MNLDGAPAANSGGQSLSSRVLRGSVWTIGGHAASNILRLVSNLILTRLLVPEMFGIMALAHVLLIGLQMLSDLGLRQNIVQSRHGNDPIFLNTVWTVQILRGGLICAIALGMAFALHSFGLAGLLPIASVYAEPSLPFIIAALSLNAFINGFESTKLATASRTLILGRLTLVDLISQVVGIFFMVVWALIERSVWALVIGSLLTSLLRVLLGTVLLPGERNKWQWDKVALQEILSFGKWVFATSILGFLAANGDRLVLGWLTDAKTLGMYSIAFVMVSGIKDVFAKLIGNVAFPAFSEVVRERPAMLKEIYYKFRRPLDWATLLVTGLLFSGGHLLVHALYDSRYFTAGRMLEILSIALFETRFLVAAQCFLALGKPKLMAPGIVIHVIALYGLMPFAFSLYGLDAAIWVAGGGVLLTIPLTIYFKIKLGLFDAIREVRSLPWLVYGLAIGWVLNQFARTVGWAL